MLGNGKPEKIIYISGNRNFKNLLIFQEKEIFELKNQKLLYFSL